MRSFVASLLSLLLNCVLVIISLTSATCFSPSATYVSRQIAFGVRKQPINKSRMMTLDESIILYPTSNIDSMTQSFQSTSTFLSTISADIENISNDEFGKVFLGGITVMIGGVVSALIVGFLLESNNSYASIVADSYAQGGDEEFWEKLSPEDQVKAKEMIAKLKASKEGNTVNAAGDATDPIMNNTQTNGFFTNVVDQQPQEGQPSSSNVIGQEQKKEKEAVSMFSDYDD